MEGRLKQSDFFYPGYSPCDAETTHEYYLKIDVFSVISIIEEMLIIMKRVRQALLRVTFCCVKQSLTEAVDWYTKNDSKRLLGI